MYFAPFYAKTAKASMKDIFPKNKEFTLSNFIHLSAFNFKTGIILFLNGYSCILF